MEGQTLILHFNGKEGFLTPDRKISLVDLGMSGMLSKFKQPAYWVLRVVRASPSKGRLFVEVMSYHAGFKAVSDAQLRNAELLEYGKIDFKNPDTSGVYASNNATGANGVTSRLEQPVTRTISDTPTQEIPSSSTPLQYAFSETFAVDYKAATFQNGQVAFEVHSKTINQAIALTVSNDHILPEYDYIKSWFPQRLGKPQFTVTATIEVVNDTIVAYKSSSVEIARINPELITAIQLQRVFNLSSAPKRGLEGKSLFTLDEAFREVSIGDEAGNIFQQKDLDVLTQLLNKSDIRNKRELQYLSGKLQSNQQPLRFTLNPKFGFLFCVEGATAHHFIWELLNSHATYVWTIEQNSLSTASQFQHIDRQISTIKSTGRQEYRAGNRTAIDRHIPFKAIHHKAKESEAGDGFSKWKEDLERYLV